MKKITRRFYSTTIYPDELRGMSTETFLKHSEVIEEKEKDVKESEA